MARTEDKSSQDSQPELSKSLILRSDQTSLETVSPPFLEIAGFSPQLPEKLMSLNGLLWAPRIKRIGINMVPGSVPVISTSIEHANEGYRVSLESAPGGGSNSADLAVFCPDSRFGFNFWVKLDDVKKFKDAILPESKAILYAQASEHLLEKEDDFTRELDSVTEKDLWELKRERATVPEYGTSTLSPFGEVELRAEGQEQPLVIFSLTSVHYMPETLLLSLTSLHYRADAKKVEMALDAVAELFSNPLFPNKTINAGN